MEGKEELLKDERMPDLWRKANQFKAEIARGTREGSGREKSS